MRVLVRTNGHDNKLLFKWDTENDVIEIVHKKELIWVQIIKDGNRGTYRVLDRRSKRKATN